MIYKVFYFCLWCGPGLNRRHKDFQSFALPTELPHLLEYRILNMKCWISKSGCKNKGILPNINMQFENLPADFEEYAEIAYSYQRILRNLRKNPSYRIRIKT